MMQDSDFIQVITTIDSEQQARELGRLAVEQRVAACAQVWGPIASTYWWQGKVDEATEWACVFKTGFAQYHSLEQLIKAHHSYSVPEILAIPVVAGNADYLAWLSGNIKQA